MISVIITAYREEKTIGKCIKSIIEQKINGSFEVIVIAPDNETLNAAKKTYKKIITIKDSGAGKWAALNMGFNRAKGDILVLCDADTYLGKNSINILTEPFKNKDVGCTSGRVISLNSKNNMLGYWSHLLVDAAHKERLKRSQKKLFIDCSGYLLGLKRGIVKELPPDLLSEDSYISRFVWSKGYDTVYTPDALVYVKYPLTFSDWIKQKRRTAGGNNQLKKYFNNIEMRGFFDEAVKGPGYALTYAKNPVEFVWSLLLFPARLQLWILAFYDMVTRKSFKKIWQRIETTK